MLDWLYGPRYPVYMPGHGTMLRNLTLDVETLFDASREIPEIVKRSGGMSNAIHPTEQLSLAYTASTEYRLRDRVVQEDDIRDMGVPDRDQITMDVKIVATEEGPPRADEENLLRSVKLHVIVDSAQAQVRLNGYVSEDQRIIREVADYLYDNSSLRPDWAGARWIVWLTPIPVALGAWAWLAFSSDWPLALHVLVLAVIVLAGSGTVARAFTARTRERDKRLGRSFSYRGESRKETHRRRADARMNVKVAVITAVITAPVAWFIGLLNGG